MGPSSTGGAGPAAAGTFKEWGFSTPEQRRAYFTATAEARLPGRPANPKSQSPIVGPGYNRLLQHVWGGQTFPGRGGSPPKGTPAVPKTPPKPPAPPPPVRLPKVIPPAPPKPKPAPKTPKTKAPAKPIFSPSIVPPPPAPSRALGNRLSESLDLSYSAASDRVKAALEAIDSVHGTGSTTMARIPVTDEYRRDVHGAFWRSRGTPSKISIKPGGPHAELTTVHENGHFLERFGLPGHNDGERDWATDPTLKDWQSAAASSKAIADLEALRGQDEIRVPHPSGGAAIYEVDDEHIDYLLSLNEVWARSYAQWIATKSGERTLLTQLDSLRDPKRDPLYTGKQWSDEDFAPIATAMDRLFESIGWRS